MPTRKQLEAARPICPVGTDETLWPDVTEPCLKPMRLGGQDDPEGGIYECPIHGRVQTPQSILSRQQTPQWLRENGYLDKGK